MPFPWGENKVTGLRLLALAAFTLAQPHYQVGQVVNTTSGRVQGTASTVRGDVSAYLGIPFAQPPVGNLRWAAPQAALYSNSVINATKYASDCPAILVRSSETFLVGQVGSKLLDSIAQVGDPQSEDCLFLNIWTKPQSGENSKAVLFWLYGGGFQIGSSASPMYDGSVLADEQDVIVVSPNYRGNIFGFATAPNVPSNVGMLDQRLALEWVRDNIAKFGGDPTRITMFGQDAGAQSVEFYSYAHAADPIANSLITHSYPYLAEALSDPSASLTAWYNVSSMLGCGGAGSGAATVSCMRTKSTAQLLSSLAADITLAEGAFRPVPDPSTAPGDFAARQSKGEFARVPYMSGNTDDETGFEIPSVLAYSNVTEAQFAQIPFLFLRPFFDSLNLIEYTCIVSNVTAARVNAGVTTYRYRYYGGEGVGGHNYTNTYFNFIGSAYNIGELPIVFGSAPSITGVADDALEAAAKKYIRTAWATFAKDPSHGLNTLAWPCYNPQTPSLARLGYARDVTSSLIPSSETDSLCPIAESLPNTDFLDQFIFVALQSYAQDGGSSVGQIPEFAKIVKELDYISSQNLSRYDATKAFLQAIPGLAPPTSQ